MKALFAEVMLAQVGNVTCCLYCGWAVFSEREGPLRYRLEHPDISNRIEAKAVVSPKADLTVDLCPNNGKIWVTADFVTVDDYPYRRR